VTEVRHRSGPEDIQSVIGTPAWFPNGKVITYESADYPSSPDPHLLIYHIADGSSGVVDLLEETGGSCRRGQHIHPVARGWHQPREADGRRQPRLAVSALRPLTAPPPAM